MNSTELLSMPNLNNSNCFSLHLENEKKKLAEFVKLCFSVPCHKKKKMFYSFSKSWQRFFLRKFLYLLVTSHQHNDFFHYCKNHPTHQF